MPVKQVSRHDCTAGTEGDGLLKEQVVGLGVLIVSITLLILSQRTEREGAGERVEGKNGGLLAAAQDDRTFLRESNGRDRSQEGHREQPGIARAGRHTPPPSRSGG